MCFSSGGKIATAEAAGVKGRDPVKAYDTVAGMYSARTGIPRENAATSGGLASDTISSTSQGSFGGELGGSAPKVA